MDYLGKKAVVVGGSSGIGLASAKFLASNGAQVTIASRNREKLEKAKDSIGGVAIYKLDATDEGQVKQFFDSITNIDYLITTVGSSIKGDLFGLDTAKIKETFNSKYWGQFLSVKYGSARVKADGSIILFAGAYSKKAIKGSFVMTSINQAIEGLAKGLAIELAPIKVNAISPGFIDTPAHSHMSDEEKQGLFNYLKESLPLKRVGQADDIVQAVDYLLRNKYTTGSTLFVDGGFSLV